MPTAPSVTHCGPHRTIGTRTAARAQRPAAQVGTLRPLRTGWAALGIPKHLRASPPHGDTGPRTALSPAVTGFPCTVASTDLVCPALCMLEPPSPHHLREGRPFLLLSATLQGDTSERGPGSSGPTTPSLPVAVRQTTRSPEAAERRAVQKASANPEPWVGRNGFQMPPKVQNQ